MNRRWFALLVVLLSALMICNSAMAAIKLACVGDSITFGYKIPDREKNSYPSQLQKMLGSAYEVRNFGVSGTTLLKKGHRPYFLTNAYKQALAFHPDVVVVELGINDSDPRDWPNYRDDFRADYAWLIDQFRSVNPKVQVYAGLLTPIFEWHVRFKSSTHQWVQEIRALIPQIAEVNHARLIDLYTPLEARSDLFADAVHPNAEGAGILARTVAQALTGNYGGIQLPQGYGDHMVLPRDQALHITGRADRGEPVTFEFQHRTQRTTADWNGNWSVTLPAQKAGGPYVLRFSTPSKTVTLNDVYFGELWLCSGQSNMDFPVSESSEASEALKMAAGGGPVIRLLHYDNAVSTNPIVWSQDVLQKVNNLKFFSGQWETENPDSVNHFSAIGFFFAQRLAQKLKVPIGIVQVSVGGSPAESWIDRQTIDNDPLLVNMMTDWQTSDFVMQWCRDRAAVNLKNATDPLQRHPYQPSYNFEAGIAPILHLPIKGVIWYQGASNATNFELYEHLFPVMVKDWRQRWGKDLPFFYVQISGLDRPAWPRFRDAQRQLADRIPNSGMVVSSDVGEADNVHYPRKKPVGDRLADMALQKVYHVPGVHSASPLPLQVIRRRGELEVRFKNTGDQLKTSDGHALRGFQLRDSFGRWRPVSGSIEGTHVLLDAAGVDHPDTVVYAWKPFPDANLVNAYGLPASTFLLKIPAHQ